MHNAENRDRKDIQSQLINMGFPYVKAGSVDSLFIARGYMSLDSRHGPSSTRLVVGRNVQD